MKKLSLITALAAIISGCSVLGEPEVRQQCALEPAVCSQNSQALQSGVEKFKAKGGMYIIKDMDSGETLENTSINFDADTVYETSFSKINFNNKTTPERLLDKYINLVKTSGKGLHQKLRENVLQGTGRQANVQNAEVYGITATTEKGSKTVVTTTFLGHFKHNDKTYAYVFVMDEPKGLKQTYGWQSAGWNIVPTAKNIIAGIAQ